MTATRAQTLHAMATQAATDLTSEWLAASRALAALAEQVAATPLASAATRQLASQQAAALTATIQRQRAFSPNTT